MQTNEPISQFYQSKSKPLMVEESKSSIPVKIFSKIHERSSPKSQQTTKNLKPQLTTTTSSQTNDNTKGGIPEKGNEQSSFTSRRFNHQPTINCIQQNLTRWSTLNANSTPISCHTSTHQPNI
jgi:hypothetical protein